MAPVIRARARGEVEEAADAEAQMRMRADTLRLLAIARGEEDPDGAGFDIRLEDGMVLLELARAGPSSPAQDKHGEGEGHTPFHEEQLVAMQALEDRDPHQGPRRGDPADACTARAPRAGRRAGASAAYLAAVAHGAPHHGPLGGDPRDECVPRRAVRALLLGVLPGLPPVAQAHRPAVGDERGASPRGAAGAAFKGGYPYLADEVARLARSKTAEQREALGRRLLQMDAAALGSLEDRFREATRAGKEAMVAKLQSEVRYVRTRIQVEAMVETIKAAAAKQK